MPETPKHAVVVQAQGHLVDSNLLNSIFEPHHRTRRRLRGPALRARADQRGFFAPDLEGRGVRHRRTGEARRRTDSVRLPCRRASRTRSSASADRDGCAPDDFYSTTNQRTAGAGWRRVDRGRAASAWTPSSSCEDGLPTCSKIREMRVGDQVVCGLEGIRVVPEFRDRARATSGSCPTKSRRSDGSRRASGASRG